MNVNILKPNREAQYEVHTLQNYDLDTLDISHINVHVCASGGSGTGLNRQSRREKCFCEVEQNQENRTSLYMTGYAQTPIVSIKDAVSPLQHMLPSIIEKTQQAMENIIDRQEIQAKDKLTADELAAIYLYTMEWEDSQFSLYSLLNTTLRSARDLEQMKPWFGFLKLFFTALMKIPSIEQTIWRGVKLDLTNDYKRKQDITWWSISSCTESIGILESDQFLGQVGARTLFSIECCRGKPIMPYSAFPTESEILLLPGTQLQVVSNVTLAQDLHIIQLKEIIPTTPCLEMPMTKQELKYERRKNHRKANVPKFELMQTNTMWPKVIIACVTIFAICVVTLSIALPITLINGGKDNGGTSQSTLIGTTFSTSITLATNSLSNTTQRCQLASLPINSYSTGSNPISISGGDFNKDGLLDITVANYGSDDVSVLYGDGGGTFRRQRTFPVGSKPYSLAIADFNGDSRSDIIMANSGNDNVGLLLGNGDETFASQRTFPAGPSPRSIVVGDFNTDGWLDVAIANYANSSLSVLLGFGNGTFRLPITTSVGSQPNSLAIGDFNNDGQLDIIVVNSGDDNIGVLLGHGNGRFSTQTTYSTGISRISVAVGDLNNDTQLDIAYVNYASHNLAILFGYGNGTFEIKVLVSLGSEPFPYSIGIDDMNQDTIPDIAIASHGSNDVRVFFSYGNGTFETPITYSTNFGGNPVSLGISDSKQYRPQGIAVTKYASNTVDIILIIC